MRKTCSTEKGFYLVGGWDKCFFNLRLRKTLGSLPDPFLCSLFEPHRYALRSAAFVSADKKSWRYLNISRWISATRSGEILGCLP